MACDQNLSRPSIRFESLGGVDLVADHCVIGSSFGADIPHNHNARVDADTHVQTNLRKLCETDAHQSFLNGEGAANRVQGIIFAGNRSAKKRHESIAAKLVECAPEFKYGVDDEPQITIEDVDHILRIELLGKRCKSPEIAEQNGDFALVPAQLQMTHGIGDNLGSHLRGNVPAEEVPEQMVFRLNVIVERLDPEERLDSCKKLLPVHGFAQKIVGPCFDSADSVGNIGQSGQHHDGKEAGGFICADMLTNFVPGHARHHYIEQNKIRRCAADKLEGRRAVLCGNYFVLHRCERPLK